ncbi:MAG: hypothetical protein JJU00_03795 [Opitutales bacterium]|nr:hypothetical protein [Opitutales bacterium]
MSVCAFVGVCATAPAAPVWEGEHEYFAEGAYSDAGAEELLLVERARGLFRVAEHSAAPEFSSARPTGVRDVDGVGVGRFVAANRDSFAVGSSFSNRVNLLGLEPVGATGVVPPERLPLDRVGPSSVLGFKLPGAVSTLLDGVAVGTRYNGAPDDHALSFHSVAGTPDQYRTNTAAGAPVALAEVVPGDGSPALLAALVEPAAGGAELALLSAANAAHPVLDTLGGLDAGMRFVFVVFDPPARGEFVLYGSGDSTVTRVQLAGDSGNPEFGAAGGTAVGFPVGWVYPVRFDGGTRLLAVSEDGLHAHVLADDGGGGLTAEQTFTAPSGVRFSGALPLPGRDGFHLFESVPGASYSTGGTYYERDGASFAGHGRYSIAPPPVLGATTNILVFTGEPFVDPQPELLAQYHYPDWTRSPSLDAGAGRVDFTAERFGGAADGLGAAEAASVSGLPAGAAHVMTNEVLPVLSIFSLDDPGGAGPGEATVSPALGVFDASITLTFQPPRPSDTVYYRFNHEGPWLEATGPVGPLYKDTVVSYYARSPGGVAGPLRHVTYSFSVAPEDMDSNRDGMPDFVRAALGLDPRGPADSDGDGFPDLVELLLGYDPLDDSDYPTRPSDLDPNVNVPDYGRMAEFVTPGFFDLLAAPRSLDPDTGDGSPFVPPLDESATGRGARVSLHNLDRAQLRTTRTTTDGLPSGAPSGPVAYFPAVDGGAASPFVVVATARNFPVQTAHEDPDTGRELLALVRPPPMPAVPVPYIYGGGDPLDEANAWLAAAQAHFAALTRPRMDREIDFLDTLALLLFERFLGAALYARGEIIDPRVTLTPFRESDRSLPPETENVPVDDERIRLSRALMRSLRHKMPGVDGGYDLAAVFAEMEDAVRAGTDAGVAHLRELARETYHRSAVAANDLPGLYPSPVRVLRAFLESGELFGAAADPPEGYAAATALSAAELAEARAAAEAVIGAAAERPQDEIALWVDTDSMGAACVRLYRVGNDSPVALLGADGDPVRISGSLRLLSGAVVDVRGYTDVEAPACAPEAMEVIAVSLVSLPPHDPGEFPGLLPPEWMWQALGDTAFDPFADLDGDGYSLLQEFLDGSDPLDPQSMPDGPPVSLAPPPVRMERDEQGQLVFRMDFPGDYAPHLRFRLQKSDDLSTPFSDQSLDAAPIGTDELGLIIPEPAQWPVFYRFEMTLR